MKMSIVRDQKEMMCSKIIVNQKRMLRIGNFHTGKCQFANL